MPTFRAAVRGLRHATASPGLIAWLLLMTLVVAMPAALLVRHAVEASLGDSLVSERLLDGFDMEWFSDYRYNTDGVAESLTPTSVRPAAFLDNLEAWFSGELFLGHPNLVATGVVFALLWSLMLGGVLYRFAHGERAFSLRSFLSRGGSYFFRFVRLGALTAVLYYLVYRFSRWLFPWLEESMRDVTVERTALAANLLAALVVVTLLVLVKLISDYAKAATVIEERQSMLLAAWRGFRFVLAHPLRTFGAYALIAAAGFAALGLYALVAPGHGQSTLVGVLVAFVLAQAFLALRLIQRLTVYATAIEIYVGATDD